MAGAFGLINLLNAQTITLADQATLRPIEGAALSCDTSSNKLLTNAAGQVDIAALKACRQVTVSHVSYLPVTIGYSELAALTGPLLLSERAYTLDEFVVSGNRFEEPRRDVPERITVLNARDIRSTGGQNTGDLLQNSGTLFVQKSQLGGGSPVIRGFEANRVLLVVDGVRLNNAIYRAGHLQDIITVDQNALDRVEVVSGPASVAYGSDALGGVINMITRTPSFRSNGIGNVGGEAMVRTSTVNNEVTAHAGIELRGARLASYTSITASTFGDLRQGSTRNPFYEDLGRRPFSVVTADDGTDEVELNDDSNIQLGTAYDQLDLLEKLRMKTGEHTVHQLNFQLSTSTDVPRYDRLSEYSLDSAGNYIPAQAEWYYGPQKRMLVAYTLELEREKGFFHTARITPSYQSIEQSRHSRGFGASRLGHNIETVGVIGLNADLEKRSGQHEFRYGLEVGLNDVQSEAYRENIVTGEETYRTTRYPNGGSTMDTYAAYFAHTMELNEHWVVSDGLRFTHVGLEATFDDSLDYQFLNGTYEQNNTALSWKAGIMYMPGREWRLSALASTGFRAPNVDDMGKVFDSAPGLVVVPNPDLEPETSTNFEFGISKTIDRQFTIDMSGFYTLLNNALSLDDFQLNGSDSVDYDGTMSRVTALVNKAEAYIYGTTAEAVAMFNEHFTLRSALTWTFGRIKTDSTDYPLDHVPPVFGRTGLQFRTKALEAEFYALYNGWKRLRDYNQLGEDNLQYATPEGMPAWCTLNVQASYAITRNFSVRAALENIGDVNYRTFASGISAPGRNFSIALRAAF